LSGEEKGCKAGLKGLCWIKWEDIKAYFENEVLRRRPCLTTEMCRKVIKIIGFITYFSILYLIIRRDNT